MTTPRHSSAIVHKAQKWSAYSLIVSFAMTGLLSLQVFAVTDTTEFTQEITAPSGTVEVRDGTPVASPTVSFSSKAYSYDCLDGAESSTGVLAVNTTERLYVENGVDENFNVTIGASAATDTWDATGPTYDFNDSGACSDGGDTDTDAGQLTVTVADLDLAADFSGGATTGLTAIAADTAFVEGSSDSIELLEGTAVAVSGRWYLTDIGMSQVIPALQEAGTYSLDMVITYTTLP
jgi:hypothetical protein